MKNTGFLNYIDCAVLKVLVPLDTSLTISNGRITKTFDKDYAIKDNDDYIIYILYFQQTDFGLWTISILENNNVREKTILINDFVIYVQTLLIPNEYQQVEYIQSSGTQWINTGVSASTENLRVKSTIMLTAVGTTNTNGGDAIWVGQWSTSGYALIRNGSNPGIIRWHSGGKYVDVTAQLNVWKTIETTKTSLIYDDKIYILNNPSGSDADKLLYLLWTSDTTGVSPIEKARAKIKITKIYSGNTLIRDMYPCIQKSNGTVGMYDVITDTFYTNSGSGEFTVGSSIDKIEQPLSIFQSGLGSLIPVTYGHESNSSISVTKNNIITNYTSTSGYQITYFNTNPIDLSQYSKLIVVSSIDTRASSDANYAGIIFAANGLPPSNGSGTHTNASVIAQTPIASGGINQVSILNLDDININGYVGLRGGMKGTISNIYLI